MKALIKSNPVALALLRPAVQWARNVKAALPKPVYRVARALNWKKQARLNQTSANFGLPSRTAETGRIHAAKTGQGDFELIVSATTERYSEPGHIDAKLHWRFAKHLTHQQDEFTVTRLPNGRAYGEVPYVIAEDDTLLLNESWEYDIPNLYDGQLFQRYHLGPVVDCDVPGAVIGTLGDHHNYFHWMLHSVPKLWLYKQSKHWPAIKKFILASAHTGYIQQTLAAVGIAPDALVETRKTPHVRFPELFASTTPSRHGHVPKFALDALREFIRPDESCKGPKKVFISRATAKIRRVLNEPEVLAALEPLGFEPVVMDKLTVLEQAAVHANAEVIVSPHGANLTNIAWCRPGTRLIEIFAPGFVQICYWRMASHVGMDYSYLLGKGTVKEGETHWDDAKLDITVDVAELKKLLSMA
jgi:hypothetical protein